MSDYISREAAIKQLELFLTPADEPRTAVDAEIDDIMDFAIAAITNLVPAADVRPAKNGHWVEALLDDEPYTEEWYDIAYNCSECGNMMIGKSAFCPWCGSDMREGKQC